MASVVRRKRRRDVGYEMRRHAGGTRDGARQSETFDDRGAAAKFQAQVEASSHQWPDGWVKGLGVEFATEPEPAPVEEHPLLGPAPLRPPADSRVSGRPHRYLSQLRSTLGWLRGMKSIADDSNGEGNR